MNLFHKHNFIQSNNPEILYCTCGETKSLHQHKWKKDAEIIQTDRRDYSKFVSGAVLTCEICGDMKNFSVDN